MQTNENFASEWNKHLSLRLYLRLATISHVKYKGTHLSYYCFTAYAFVKRKYFHVTQSFAITWPCQINSCTYHLPASVPPSNNIFSSLKIGRYTGFIKPTTAQRKNLFLFSCGNPIVIQLTTSWCWQMCCSVHK